MPTGTTNGNTYQLGCGLGRPRWEMKTGFQTSKALMPHQSCLESLTVVPPPPALLLDIKILVSCLQASPLLLWFTPNPQTLAFSWECQGLFKGKKDGEFNALLYCSHALQTMTVSSYKLRDFLFSVEIEMILPLAVLKYLRLQAKSFQLVTKQTTSKQFLPTYLVFHFMSIYDELI